MNSALYLARRLSLGADGHKSSPALKVCVAAVALSVAVMLAAIAVVTGFKQEIRDKVFGFNSHITLYALPASEDDSNLLTLTPTLSDLLDNKPYITDYALEASIPAILKTQSDFKGVYMRSVEGKGVAEFIKKNMETGSMPDYSQKENEQSIVISSIAAKQLNLKVGDKIDTYFISDNLRVRRMEVAGIYNTHFDNYDRVIIYGALPIIQQLGGVSRNQATSIVINTDNIANVEQYAADLQQTLMDASVSGYLNRYYQVDNAYKQGAGYFQWLSLLDTNVVVILTLMIIVAIATLISGMLILILDKDRFIGIIRALGASVKNVRRVFVFLALKIAAIGMLIGNLLMLTLLEIQDKTHLLPLDAEAYYIDFVPVKIDWSWVAALNIGVFVVIYLSLALPSRFVAKISPAESMRSE